MGTLVEVPRGTKHRMAHNDFEQKLDSLSLLSQTFRIWIDNSFDDPNAKTEIMSPMPDAKEFEEARQTATIPKDAIPEIAHLFLEPLLTDKQEYHLFRQMNYLRYQAKKLLDAKSKRHQHIIDLLSAAAAVQKQIVASNLRLAMRFAKECAARNQAMHELFDIVSDANLSCIQAVNCFNWTRGLKFSTYAVSAIKKNLWQSMKEKKIRNERETTGWEDLFFIENKPGFDPFAEKDNEERQTFIGSVAHKLLEKITEKDNGNTRRAELLQAYRLCHDKKPPLHELGKQFGITKERVRQLNQKTMTQMREMLQNGEVSLNGIAGEFIEDGD